MASPTPSAADVPGARPAVREVVVDDDHAGQRIDNFLIARLKGVPRSRIYRCLRRGEVRVDGRRIRQHYRLHAGERVRLPPLRTAAPPAASPGTAGRAALRDRILHEDDCLLVLDKPAGLAVHGGSGVRHGVIEMLRAGDARAQSFELVHRLDRDTSGCLLVAKRRSTLRALHAALREGEVDKRYLALVRGRLTRGAVLESKLHRTAVSGERMVRAGASGKASRTRVEPLASTDLATLIEARPLTGRTHQIRVQVAAAGHPVAGDAKYGDRDFNRRLRELGLRRQFLHASMLRFLHPRTGERLSIHAPLPADLVEALHGIGLREPPPPR